MTAFTVTTPSTSGRRVIRLGVAAVLTAVAVGSLPIAWEALAMKGEREGRSTAPITLAGGTGNPAIAHFRSTAPAELAGEGPAALSYRRSTSPVSLW